MNITIDRPYAFYGLLFIIPAVIYVVVRYRYLSRLLGGFVSADPVKSFSAGRLRTGLILRTFCRVFSWILLVCAYAGISWGAIAVPVQKNGHAVSLVFDISYSMMAKDAPGGVSRLKAATEYAEMLLQHTSGLSVSVVLVKGDGFIAIPLTEDTAMVYSLLENLSPELMSAPGSSLGKGIETAIRSFPQNSAQSETVWVFTDCEETDGLLEPSLDDAAKYSVPVTFIGFGSEKGTKIITGDGKTKVETSLHSTAVSGIITRVLKRSVIDRRLRSSGAPIFQYVNATDSGSALKVLKTVENGNSVGKNDIGIDESQSVSYELKQQQKKTTFIVLSIILFALGFVLGEFDFRSVKRRFTLKKKKATESVLVVLMCLMVVSCSGSVNDSRRILQSTWAWHQKKYRQATAGFLRVVKDNEQNGSYQKQYALLGLASTYIMLDENEAALNRIKQIAPDAPKPVRFAALYNAGIIKFREGDYSTAEEYFRDALLVDGTNIDAKINFELCSRQAQFKKVKGGEQELTPSSESQSGNPDMENAIFKRIRENDRKLWKNRETNQSTSQLDY